MFKLFINSFIYFFLLVKYLQKREERMRLWNKMVWQLEQDLKLKNENVINICVESHFLRNELQHSSQKLHEFTEKDIFKSLLPEHLELNLHVNIITSNHLIFKAWSC